MRTLLTGLALLGLGAAAYKYRAQITDELNELVPSAKSLKQTASRAVDSITSSAQENYGSARTPSYAEKSKKSA